MTGGSTTTARPDLQDALGLLLAGLVVIAAAHHAASLNEISSDDWLCSATHPEQEPIGGTQGVSYRTVRVCDQWTRR